MFYRVVLPLLETGGALAGRVVKPSLNVLVGAIEWCAKWTR